MIKSRQEFTNAFSHQVRTFESDLVIKWLNFKSKIYSTQPNIVLVIPSKIMASWKPSERGLKKGDTNTSHYPD